MIAHLMELTGVTKRFTDDEWILEGVDISLDRGDTVAIVGPSGSGKSTLLNIMGTLLPPTAGSVCFEGQDLTPAITKAAHSALAFFRNANLGFVFQSHHLLPQCSALENVLVPTLVIRDRSRRKAKVERAQDLLAKVGLADRMHHLPSRLSGGERQRVAVIRALINQPSLILADEPTGSLDARSSETLGELLFSLSRDNGTAVLVVTHELNLARRAQRRLQLSMGRLQPWEDGA